MAFCKARMRVAWLRQVVYELKRTVNTTSKKRTTVFEKRPEREIETQFSNRKHTKIQLYFVMNTVETGYIIIQRFCERI